MHGTCERNGKTNDASPSQRFDMNTIVQVDGGNELILSQSRGDADDGESQATVFDAARVLCNTLQHILLVVCGFQSASNIQLCDLGASTGVVGLACASLGCSRVFLTDVPQMVPLMQSNIQRNQLQNNTIATALSWGADSLPGNAHCNLVAICECTHAIQEHENLIHTAHALLDPNDPASCVLVVSERRGDVNMFFRQSATALFVVTEIMSSELIGSAKEHAEHLEFLILRPKA